MDICQILQDYCDTATAVDDTVTVNSPSLQYNIGANDTSCLFGATTWVITNTTNVTVTPTTSTNGIVTIAPSASSFSFTYDIKCSGNTQDNATVSGTYTPVSLSQNTITNVNEGDHFTSTTYAALTDGTITRPTTDINDYRIHEEGKNEGVIGWEIDTVLEAGTAQIYWSNDDDGNGTDFDLMGLTVSVGSYNSGTPSFGYTATIMGAAVATDYTPTPSTVTIPSGVMWSYIEIRSVNDNTGQDPIIWEVRINNVPN